MPRNGGTASIGDTEIEVFDGRKWEKTPIRKFVLENFDLSRPGIDRLGTYYSDPARPFFTRSVDTTGGIHLRKITSVSIHRSPATLIRFKTARGRELVVTPDHAMLVWDTGYLRKVKADGDRRPATRYRSLAGPA